LHEEPLVVLVLVLAVAVTVVWMMDVVATWHR
jgi:hypothetical protein